MKKRLKGVLFGTALISIFALAGCGGNSASDTAEEITEVSAEGYVQTAMEMLETADSFSAEFEAVVSMNGTDETTTEGQITLVKEPLYMQVDTEMSFGSEEQEYVIYLEENEETINQYMGYDGQWTEMTMAEEDALASVQLYHTLYNLETILSAAENWQMEENGKTVELTGVIPEGKFYAVEEYTRWFQLAGMSGLSEVYFSGVGDVPVTVVLDSKTGAPVSYEVELAAALEAVTNNVLKELSGGTLESGVTVETYTLASELTQLGGVEAGEIPAEAKSDAINYEKEISMLESKK